MLPDNRLFCNYARRFWFCPVAGTKVVTVTQTRVLTSNFTLNLAAKNAARTGSRLDVGMLAYHDQSSPLGAKNKKGGI
jgi:hypothetical protein